MSASQRIALVRQRYNPFGGAERFIERALGSLEQLGAQITLIAREWTRLFVDLRSLWGQTRLVLFGHALTEKLVSPYKSITGHVYRAPVPPELGDDVAAWDRWLAARLTAAELATKPFTPLPVLGVPGWWLANQDPAFYDDAAVFRPPRTAFAPTT